MLAELPVSGAAHQLAANCTWVGRDGDVVRLKLDRRSEALRTPGTEERLAQALAKHLGANIRLVIERDESVDVTDGVDTPARREALAREAQVAKARAALEADPTVQALKQKFGASVQMDTVKPIR